MKMMAVDLTCVKKRLRMRNRTSAWLHRKTGHWSVPCFCPGRPVQKSCGKIDSKEYAPHSPEASACRPDLTESNSLRLSFVERYSLETDRF